MDDSLYNFFQIFLEQTRVNFQERSIGMVRIGSSLAAIGAVVYIAYIVFKGWLDGSYWNPRLLRPFMFLMIIGLYPYLISGLDGIMVGVNNSAAFMIEPGGYRLTEILDNQNLDPTVAPGEEVATSEDLHVAEEESTVWSLNDMMEVIGGFNPVNWIGEKVYLGFMRVVEEILWRTSQGVIMFLNVLRTFILIFLYIIGPLSLAIAVFPGFEDSAITWLGRYISTHLWLAIGIVFEAVMLEFYELVVETGGFGFTALLLGGQEMQIANTISWMFLGISIFGHLSIPFLADWIINAKTVNGGVAKIALATKIVTKI